MMTLKGRREAMGFTQTALAERIGIAQSHYGQIELGKTRAKPETRRAISQALGMRHIDLLVELGELEDWEAPGFSADTPEPDPDLARRIAMLEQLDLDRDNRGSTLDVVLQGWAAQDRARSPHLGRLLETSDQPDVIRLVLLWASAWRSVNGARSVAWPRLLIQGSLEYDRRKFNEIAIYLNMEKRRSITLPRCSIPLEFEGG